MSCTTSDGLDRSFVALIKEIERGYHMLSKQYRLRVEKWIEKLVTSGGQNLVWRKHRNEYTKLLLHMVISKKLTEPFHIFPPDGPLPQFPKHIAQYHLKEKASDAHELSFWKDIYIRLNASTSQYKPDETIGDEEIITLRDIPSNRELKYLKLCDTENKIRIELLEQQLRDEKLHYGLQVQRLEYAHRAEVSSYAETITSSSNFNNQSSILENQITDDMLQNKKQQDQQRLSQEMSFHRDTCRSPNRNRKNDYLTESNRNSFDEGNRKNDYILESNRNSLDESKENTGDYSRQQNDRLYSNESKRNDTGRTSPQRNPGTYNDTQASPRKQSSVNFRSYENRDRSQSPLCDNEYSRNLDKSPSLSDSSFRDLSSFRSTKRSSPTTAPKFPNSLSGIAIPFERNRSFSPNLSCNNSIDVSSSSDLFRNASAKPRIGRKTQQTEDDFLVYIEEFQTEIKKLQDSSPMRKVRSSN